MLVSGDSTKPCQVSTARKGTIAEFLRGYNRSAQRMRPLNSPIRTSLPGSISFGLEKDFYEPHAEIDSFLYELSFYEKSNPEKSTCKPGFHTIETNSRHRQVL
jgi:hypothetical protein